MAGQQPPCEAQPACYARFAPGGSGERPYKALPTSCQGSLGRGLGSIATPHRSAPLILRIQGSTAHMHLLAYQRAAPTLIMGMPVP